MPEMNYNPLRGRMRECGLTQKECAAKIGLREYDFKQDEIHSLCRLLDIDAAEIGHYFFCPKS